MSSIPHNVEIDPIKDVFPDDDPTAAERKKDHIELAFKSQITAAMLDERFYYEPLLAAHPTDSDSWPAFEFLGQEDSKRQ